MSDKLLEHLAEIERTARAEVESLTKRLAEAQGVIEQLKAENPMQWVGLMNNAKAQAEEMVYAEIVYMRGK